MVTVTTYRAVWWHGDRTEGFPTTYNCTSKRVCIRWRTVYQSDLCSIIKLKWVKAAHGPRTHANWRRSSYSASNKFAKYYSCTFAVLNSQYVATHVGAYSCCLHALKLDQCMYRRQRDHLNGLLFYIVYRCVVLSIMISVMIFFPRTIVILTSTQKHTRVLYWNNQYLSLVYEISNSKSVNTAYNIPVCVQVNYRSQLWPLSYAAAFAGGPVAPVSSWWPLGVTYRSGRWVPRFPGKGLVARQIT